MLQNERRLGVGRKHLQGKRTEHVQSSALREGGHGSAVLEILGGMEREREFKGERGVWPHSGDFPQNPQMERVH